MATYTLISSVTVGAGGAAYIDLTSIPATYTDLSILASIRSNRTGVGSNLTLKFNNTTANYFRIELNGDGATVAGSGAASAAAFEYIYIPSAGSAANTFNNLGIYIPNYASSINKSFGITNAQEDNANTAYTQLETGLWSDSSAISSIRLTEQYGSNLSQYSTAYLYGISNA